MRKNGSRLISIKQYRTTDLFLFALIMIIAELAVHFAAVWFSAAATFTFSFIVPITLIVMMRWGWPSVIIPVVSALAYCMLNGGGPASYFTYVAGNAFIMLMLLPLYLFGKEKTASTWYFSALFAIGGWLCVYLGRASAFALWYAVFSVEGVKAYQGFISFAASDLFSLAMAIIIVVVMRRLDGMFEDQKAYLIRQDKERKDRMRADEYGLEPIEIDEETLNILKKDNELYK